MSGWTSAVRHAADGEYFVRVRAPLPEPPDRARFPVAIWVTWPRATEDDDSDAMAAFEGAVDALVERDGRGLLIAVVTTGAAREWLWQAADATDFVDGVRDALASHPTYPFELRAWDDPTWRAARELAGPTVH